MADRDEDRREAAADILGAAWFAAVIGAELSPRELDRWADYYGFLSYCFHSMSCLSRGKGEH